MNDLCNRLFDFSINTLQFLKQVKYSDINKVLIYQLAKSATSCGANYEEAQAASSKADFINKINISLKEIREANYWLRLIEGLDIGSTDKIDSLIQESNELKKILGKILSTSRKNQKNP
ncbi:MAG: four helix bundle protein [Bacteroidetes bacterium]|nr:four helix bundle protein [Bacteroidota bacterium]